MKADVYILGLFTFNDEEKKNKVFSDKDLENINLNLEQSPQLTKDSSEQMSRWRMYNIDMGEIGQKISKTTIVSSTLGYYHHRVIFRFQLSGKNIENELRKIRSVLKEYAESIIKDSIIKPNESHGFFDCDTYQLIIVQNRNLLNFKKEDAVFSNDTTTMTFDINEPSAIMPVGKKYNIRISIPSTIITSKDRVSDDFIKAMINAIYQSCLYEIKEKRREEKELEIELSEDQLVNLWQHVIDTMGGRTLDKNIAKISQTNYFVAFAAFIVAIIAFDLDKLFSNATTMKKMFYSFLNLFI
jgi:hypothetical protein